MYIAKEEIIKVHLTLNLEEATWLKDLTQNCIAGESAESYTMREQFFMKLKDILDD